MKGNLRILAFGLLILSCVIASTLLATGLVLYYNPSSVKPLLENYLSGIAGGRVRIERLAYSIRPLRVQAEDVKLDSETEQGNLSLEVPFVEAEMALEGPFTRRRLLVRHLKAKGVRLRAKDPLKALRIPPKKRPLPTGLLQRLSSLLLFRDMSWESAEIIGDRLNVEQGLQVLRAENLKVNVISREMIDVLGRISVLLPERNTQFSSGKLHLDLRSDEALPNSEISGIVTAEDASLKDPALVLEGIKIQARLHYSGETKSLAIQSFEVDSQDLVFKNGLLPKEKTLTFHLEGQGKLSLEGRILESASFAIGLDSIHRLRGRITASLSDEIEVHLRDLKARLFPSLLLPLIPEMGGIRAKDLEFYGPFDLLGNVTARRKARKWHLAGDLRGVLDGNEFSYTSRKIRLYGRPRGRILVRGDLSRPAFHIGLNGVEGAFARGYLVKDIRLESEGRYDVKARSAIVDKFEARSKLLKATGGIKGASIPLKLRLGKEARVDLGKKELRAAFFLLRGGNLFEMKGSLELNLGPQPNIAIRLLDSRLFPRYLLPYITRATKARPETLDLGGPVILRGLLESRSRTGQGGWQFDGSARFTDNPLSFSLGKYRVKSTLSGSARLKGRYPDLQISARIVAGNTVASFGEKIKTSPFRAAISLSGNPGHLIMEDFNAHIPLFNIFWGGREAKVQDTVLEVRRGEWERSGPSVVMNGISLRSPLLGQVTGMLRINRKETHLTFEAKEIHLLRSAEEVLLLPKDWTFSSSDVLRAEAVIARDGRIRFRSMLKVQGFGFQNRDGAIMGEGLGLDVNARGEADLRSYRTTIAVTAAILSGELLYDRFYLDFAKHPFDLSCEGTYDPVERAWSVKPLDFGLKDLVSFTLGGVLSNQDGLVHARISVDIPPTPIRPLFLVFLSEPLKAERPFLGKLKVDGSVSSRLELLTRGGDWALLGRLLLRHGELSSGHEGFSLKGIDLDLPVWLEQGLTKLPGTGVAEGFLSIDTLTLPALGPQSVRVPLIAGPNRWMSESPVRLSLFGGDIELGPFQLENLLRREKAALVTSLDVRSLEIQPILSKIKMPMTPGAIYGTLDPIWMQGNNITTRGEVTAEAYGGHIIFSGISLSDPFAPGPLFKMDIRIKDLLLADLTTGTSFGKIQGVLTGYVKDLEIAFGQPQRFDLMLETIKKKGDP